jgi:hypothetical protein
VSSPCKCDARAANLCTTVQAHFVQSLQANRLLEDTTFAMVVRISFDMLVVNATQLACLEDPPPHTALSDSFMQLLGAITARSDSTTAVVHTVCLAARTVVIDVAKRRKAALLPRPLHRILLGILNELPLAGEGVPWDFGLVSFSHVLLDSQPLKVRCCWMLLLWIPLLHTCSAASFLRSRFRACAAGIVLCAFALSLGR